MQFSDYLLAAPFVVFFFGFCIFIHELGHFLAAKWRGLHIVAFSIGFKRVWGFKHNGIDYRIGCIPIGGYVDLPQIDATGEPTDENGNPLPPAKPIDKIITALAGPLFNVLFGIFLSLFVWHYGVPQGTPRMERIKVASIDAASPEYKAGLREGDVIMAVNGKAFNCTWNEFARKFIFAVKNVTLDVERGGERLKITYQPIPNVKQTPREKVPYPFFMPEIPVKCVVRPNSPAAKAGMRTGDIVVAVNGKPVEELSDFEEFLEENDGGAFDLTVSREGRKIVLKDIKPKRVETGLYQIGVALPESLNAIISNVTPPEVPSASREEELQHGDKVLRANGEVLDSPYRLTKIVEKASGAPISFLIARKGRVLTLTKIVPPATANIDGAGSFSLAYQRSREIWCAKIFPGSPAEKAGLKPFDRILSINGVESPSFKTFQKTVLASKGAPVTLVVERDARKLTLTVAPKERAMWDIGLGFHWVNHPTPWEQFKQVIVLTYKSLRSIFKGKLGMKHLSGPVGIFRGIAVTYVNGGIMKALSLIVMITYSLAILNIMPLPVLDGGHIVLALIQWGTGKPLSPKIVQPMFVVFVVLLLSMMLYVTFYDVLRFIPVTREYRFFNIGPKEFDASNVR